MKDPTFEIVGVVATAKNQGIQDPTMPEAFVPTPITGGFERGHAGADGDPPHPLLQSVRREIWRSTGTWR